MWTLVLCLLAVAPGEEVVETWPDGTLRARYQVNEEGVRHGPYQEFHSNGKRRVRTTYRVGILSGTYEEYHANGKKARDAKYRDGVLEGKYVERDQDGHETWVAAYRKGALHGKVEAFEGSRRLVSQKWREGLLVEYEGFAPFPRPLAELRATLAALTDPQTPLPGSPPAPEVWGTSDEVEASDPGLRQAREDALRTLAAYRYLCGVPHEGLSLDPEYNRLARMGAKLCDAIGRLDHTPANPGWPEDEYRDGYAGTSRSNLAGGSGLARSVHSYMDDSDPTNIDAVGHRKWCLAPRLQRTGFGRHGRFSAMYVFDGSGRGGGAKQVCYPPAGHVPVDYFGARHAWSVTLPDGALPDPDELSLQVRPLDERLIPGEPLALDHLGRSGGTLVFRPVGVSVAAGERYLVSIEGLRGAYKKGGLRYLVCFEGPGEDG